MIKSDALKEKKTKEAAAVHNVCLKNSRNDT